MKNRIYRKIRSGYKKWSHFHSLAPRYSEAHGPLPSLYWLWFWPWLKSLREDRAPFADRIPWVTFDSMRAIAPLAHPGARVCEFGMGGSTLYFVDRGCSVVSIDHHRDWFEKTKEAIGDIDTWEGRLAEPEEIGQEQTDSELCRSAFPRYVNMDFRNYVRSIATEGDESFDVVFVDGRSRVAAALASAEKVKKGGRLILDNSERERYQPIHTYFQENQWSVRRFPGPGPYRQQFWETSIWTRP